MSDRTYRHDAGDNGPGCEACCDEAVDAYLNGGEAFPSCQEPNDDGDGSCDVCGHAVREVIQ